MKAYEHYRPSPDPDGSEWPGFTFTTRDGLQVTVTAVEEGSEEKAEHTASLLGLYLQHGGYILPELVLAVTMQDVISQATERDIPPDAVLDRQRSIEKAFEWAIMEHVWDVVASCLDDIESSLAREDALEE